MGGDLKIALDEIRRTLNSMLNQEQINQDTMTQLLNEIRLLRQDINRIEREVSAAISEVKSKISRFL